MYVGNVDLPHNLQRLLDDGYAQMRPVIDEPRNIVLRHLRQLFLEYALQARQYDGALPPPVIVDHAELDVSLALLEGSRVLGEGHYPLLRFGRRIVDYRGRRRALLLCTLGRADVERVVRFALNWRTLAVSLHFA